MNGDTKQFALIDRLATSELDESERRDLFFWLDREPVRWRRCAMVLLETRELEHAFDNWRAEVPRRQAPLQRPSVVRPFRWGAMTALAASIMIAFSVGVVARGWWLPRTLTIAHGRPARGERAAPPVPESHEKATASAVHEPNSKVSHSVTKVAAVMPAAGPAADLIPSYVRGQWERRGYQVKSRPALLPVVLPDGRKATLPVDELQFNYVGHRAY